MDHRNYSVLSFPGHHFDPQDPERRADYWIDLIESPDEERKFLGGVHYQLNIGIYYMASILTYIKDWYVKCSLDIEEGLTQVILDMGMEALLLWLFLATGNAATILALISTLSDKKEALIAPLQGTT